MAPQTRKRKAEGEPPSPTATPKELTGAELLQCTICFDTAASPINSCPNGHIICGLCVDKIQGKKCPTCNEEPLKVNAALELIAKRIDVKLVCPNSSLGCKELVLSTAVKDHLKNTCYFRDIRCIFDTCLDNTVIPFPGYVAHLEAGHTAYENEKIVYTPENSKKWTMQFCFIASEQLLKLEERADGMWAVNCDRAIIWLDQTFILHQIVSQGTFYTWVTMMGTPAQAAEADVRFSIKLWVLGHKNDAFTCTGLPVVALNDHSVSNADNGWGLNIRLASLGRLAQHLKSNIIGLELTLERNN